MPGHYLALAGSFALLGSGAFSAMAPGLLAFVIAAVACWDLARRLLGAGSAWLAAVLFIAFPANAVYAFTAMAELPFVAASALAICIFVALPPALRAPVGPFALVLPFFFRETAALLIVPLVLLLPRDGSPSQRAVRAGVFVAVSALALGLCYATDVSSGRGSLFAANFFSPSMDTIYRDAAPRLDASWSRIPGALAARVGANLAASWEAVLHAGSGFEVGSVVAFLAAAAAGLAFAAARDRDRTLPLASALLILAVATFVLAFYAVDLYRAVRMLLFTWPLACVAWARLAAELPLPRTRALRASLLALILVAGLAAAAAQRSLVSAGDARDDRDVAFLETLRHDDTTLLIAPWWISLAYVHHHHPVEWSFVPANDATLDLLAEHHRVGTLLLPHAVYASLPSQQAIARAGLELVGTLDHEGRAYLWYRRAQPP
jgi:hypothetical protein